MRPLKSLFAIAATALAVLAAPTLAQADKLQDVLGAGKLRVGLLTDAAPWGFKDDKGEIAGLDADLARLIAADMGVKLELVPVTGAARIPSLLSDKIDILIAGLGATPERAQQVMFSQPYAVVNLGVYGAKAIPAATGKKPDNLDGRSVAVAKGSTLRRLAHRQRAEGEAGAFRGYAGRARRVSRGTGRYLRREQRHRAEGAGPEPDQGGRAEVPDPPVAGSCRRAPGRAEPAQLDQY
ncbi:ABC-type amino acid transport substrate-binding protein [Bradyrhizobium sp. i1.7.7]